MRSCSFFPPSNPPVLPSPILAGFLCLAVRNANKGVEEQATLMDVKIPIEILKPYHPVHLVLFANLKELHTKLKANNFKLYTTLTLELPMTKISESVCAVVVKSLEFDPIPRCTNRCALLLAGNGQRPSALPFSVAVANSEVSVSQAVAAQNRSFPLFMSSVLKIPSSAHQSEYFAVTYFLIPRSLLATNVAVHLLIQTEEDMESQLLPGTTVGATDFIEEDLKRLTGSAGHRPILFPVDYARDGAHYNELRASKCVLEMTCLPYGEGVGGESVEESKGVLVQGEGVGDREKWKVLSRELGQKQEILNMIMREIDERKQSLKASGEEIGDLRRSIHLLADENKSLKQRLHEEENLQQSPVITNEIYKMPRDELRIKLLKLAQAYKAERQRNEEFEKALKKAHMQISSAKKMEEELGQVQAIHEERARKLLDVRKEIPKIDMYKEIVLKQEKVMAKMENLLNKAANNARHHQQDIAELDGLKREISLLQRDIRSSAIQESEQEIAAEKYQREIAQMEEQVVRLKKELSHRNENGSGREADEQWDRDKIELEVRLQKAEARDKAIDYEMNQNVKAYDAEIERLKLELAKKQAMVKELNITPEGTLM